ncbi:MAG: L-serine ammonia-lyase, iron-sulfur-dependent, subunit alpha, partial [Clostridia bacterium]|nr:L-serine ammonia-lyase, iron-sulfur-dependent, subunit alpha [Clostridia bacterium]
MKSLRQLYKIGRGPSSSHTMGPERASRYFMSITEDADSYRVTFYGSLALTGVGHQSDVAVKKTICHKPVEIIFDIKSKDIPHANTMDFTAFKDGKIICEKRILSVGGGDIKIVGEEGSIEEPDVYSETCFDEIASYCRDHDIRLSDYVYEKEDEGIKDYLRLVWDTMKEEIRSGLNAEGILPGGLGVQRVAKLLLNRRHIDERAETKEHRIVCSYAFAAAEHNADCGTIVTAPTCGACAVVPAVLRYMQEKHNFSDEKIIDALAVGGLIGNIVKRNASVSGAECGCQAEIGTACSMAAAALGELYEMDMN